MSLLWIIKQNNFKCLVFLCADLKPSRFKCTFVPPLREVTSCFKVLWANLNQELCLEHNVELQIIKRETQAVNSASMFSGQHCCTYKLATGQDGVWDSCLFYLQHPGFSSQQIWDKSAFCKEALKTPLTAYGCADCRESRFLYREDNQGREGDYHRQCSSIFLFLSLSGYQPSSSWLNYTGRGVLILIPPLDNALSCGQIFKGSNQ